MAEKTPLEVRDELLRDIDGFEASMFPPTVESCEHDTLVGDCPPELQKFYAFARCCERDMKQLRLENEFAAEEDPEVTYRMWQLYKKRELVYALFWFGLWEHFKRYGILAEGKKLGIRRGWKVVIHDVPPNNMPPGIQAFFGMIPPQE